jgi:uncharacterized membrane protein YvbJ
MAYCPHCGKEVNDEAVVCIHCGCSIKQDLNQAPAVQDASSFGFGVLGFCIPIVGLILYLIWKDKTPLKAKSAGIGALVGFILGVIVNIIYFSFFASMLGSLGSAF